MDSKEKGTFRMKGQRDAMSVLVNPTSFRETVSFAGPYDTDISLQFLNLPAKTVAAFLCLEMMPFDRPFRRTTETKVMKLLSCRLQLWECFC